MCHLCKQAKHLDTEEQLQLLLNQIAQELPRADKKKKKHLNDLMNRALGFVDELDPVDPEFAEAWERNRRD